MHAVKVDAVKASSDDIACAAADRLDSGVPADGIALGTGKNADQERLCSQFAQLRLAVDRAAIVSEVAPDGSILYANDQYCVALGWQREHVVGRDWLFARVRDGVNEDDPLYDWSVRQRDVCVRHQRGSLVWLRSTRVPMFGLDGKLDRYLCIDMDVSRQHAAEGRMAQLAELDELTGLPNRRQFFTMIERHVDRRAADQSQFALLHLDLFDFRQVNDALGHAAGDAVLREAARRMESGLPAGASLARVGGDEFSILLPDCGNCDEVLLEVERLFTRLDAPFVVLGGEVHIAASVGISSFPEDGADASTLVKNADLALHLAKSMGKRRWVLFSQDLAQGNRERLDLERELRRALELDQFSLEYQPKYHLGFDRIVGAEALLRWTHPTLGRVSPARFIPVAEQSELIIPIGQWVIREVCRQIVSWQAQGVPPMQVALNLSAVQFRSAHLFEDITSILAEFGVLPGQIELEITESLLMDDPAAAIGLLVRLKEADFSLAIDDFGTGYSSLSYLKKFPISVLKIDRSFVKDLETDLDDRAIAAAIVSMAGALVLDVVAEGAETVEQLDLLREMGCDYVQGYCISRPLAPDAFANFVSLSAREGIQVGKLATRQS